MSKVSDYRSRCQRWISLDQRCGKPATHHVVDVTLQREKLDGIQNDWHMCTSHAVEWSGRLKTFRADGVVEITQVQK